MLVSDAESGKRPTLGDKGRGPESSYLILWVVLLLAIIVNQFYF